MASDLPQGYVVLPGSVRGVPTDCQHMGPVPPDERIEVSIYVRPAQPGDVAAQAASRTLTGEPPLSRAAYAERFGADPAAIAAVENFARDHGMTVVQVDPARRLVVLSGTVAQLSDAFQVNLQRYQRDDETFRARSGPIHVPESLAPYVDAVLGLDDRPTAQPRFRIYQPPAERRGFFARLFGRIRAATGTQYSPREVAKLYNFPLQLDGAGQTIGLIELGGGYRETDLQTYFAQLRLPPPQVVSVSVDGADNAPSGDPSSADGEVVLDIEVAGAVAPGARIAVYFAPNSDRGFIDAITTAIHDTQNTPSILSISWGLAESGWTQQAVQQMNAAFQAAAALGVTVFCAAGDAGAGDNVGDGLAHADFPASSPYVLGCGGTRVQTSDTTLTGEVVWNEPAGGATGGGVSDTFPLPDYQANVGVPPSINPGARVGRGVPDVAGNADPATGYTVLVDGQAAAFGGTSAVAPLWAGLTALINQQLGRPAGYLNPVLYQRLPPGQGFRDITVGDNGGYRAGAGWDACTGLGSPDGQALLDALTALAGGGPA